MLQLVNDLVVRNIPSTMLLKSFWNAVQATLVYLREGRFDFPVRQQRRHLLKELLGYLVILFIYL